MHWATELGHPRKNVVKLGPRSPFPAAPNCLEAQNPRKDSLRALEQLAFFSQPREPTMSFYSMAYIGHRYRTQRRGLKRPRGTSHSHCECSLLVLGRSTSQAERTRSYTASVHSSNQGPLIPALGYLSLYGEHW